MGIFSKFRKNKETSNTQPIKKERPTYDLKVSSTPDGKIQVEFEEFNPDIRQFYDTTRLIVGQAQRVDGATVYDCVVSWYNSGETLLYSQENSSRTDYKNVLAGINPTTILQDESYCKFVMEKLFQKKRVERYLEQGLSDRPETPCGNYIGGVCYLKDGKLQKYFAENIGKAVHYSPSMVNKRNRHREEQRRQSERSRIIAEKNRQISKLQEEIQDLSR